MEPRTISGPEWAKLRALREVEEGWGLGPDDTAEALAQMAYGVRFDFQSGGPGYCGPLYLLVGDGDPRYVLTVTRDREGHLVPVQAGPSDNAY